MGGRRADAPRDAIEKGRVAGDRARVEQREQEFRVVDFELGEVGHLPDLMADREARIPQRMQDGAHPFLFGFLDLAVEQEQDVDVRVQTQVAPTVAAERDDEAGDGRARCFSEQPFEEFVEAVRKAPKGRASALAARGSRRQLLSRAFHGGERRRHARYATGAGNDELPMRYASTPRAQLRPSAIAQTMSDWPRCMSPAAKTPGTFVIQFALRATVPRAVSAMPRPWTTPFGSGPTNPIASSTRSASNSTVVFVSTCVACSRATRPSAVPENRSVPMA